MKKEHTTHRDKEAVAAVFKENSLAIYRTARRVCGDEQLVGKAIVEALGSCLNRGECDAKAVLDCVEETAAKKVD